MIAFGCLFAGFSTASNSQASGKFTERGSIAPLAIGLLAVSVATILTVVAASSLYVFQRRLTSVAEFAALAEAARGVDVRDFLVNGNNAADDRLVIKRDESLDGLTREVELCGVWHPPVPVFASLTQVEVCATGLARRG